MVGVTFRNQPKCIYPTRDISLCGMFLVGCSGHRADSVCDITLNERWANRQFVLRLSGRIVRLERDGIAIRYTEMSLDTFSLLQTLLLYESRNPTAMGEEFTQECRYTIRGARADSNQLRSSGRIW